MATTIRALEAKLREERLKLQRLQEDWCRMEQANAEVPGSFAESDVRGAWYDVEEQKDEVIFAEEELKEAQTKGETMNWKDQLQKLLMEVTACPVVTTSVDKYCNGIADIFGTIAADATAVQQFAMALKTCGAGAAIVANTPKPIDPVAK